MPEEQELRTYYESELDYLRRMGADFAQRFQGIASQLELDEDKCNDPHIERLLEGVALLTARVRRKIDDEFPEITDALLGLVYPLYQRPIPALTIVQLHSKATNIAAAAVPEVIPRGSELESRPVKQLTCKFRTSYPVTLWPIEVAEAHLATSGVVVRDMPDNTTALLDVVLRTTGGSTPIRFETLATPPPPVPGEKGASTDPGPLDRLRFYLDGTGTAPYILYELLLNHVLAIEVAAESESVAQGPSFRLKPDALRPVGFGIDADDNESVLEDSTRSFPGYRLLQEYLAFPKKFLFVELTGLGRLARDAFGTAIVLRFFLDREPPGPLVVTPENLRLGCAPAVNLFPVTATGISLNQQTFEYPVVPDEARPDDVEVYSIEKVVSVESIGGRAEGNFEYQPFYSLKHAFTMADANASRSPRTRTAYWWASRRPRLRTVTRGEAGAAAAHAQGVPDVDAGTNVALAFVDSEFRPHLPARSKVSVTTLCTNRDLPARLPRAGGRLELLPSPGKPLPISVAHCLSPPTESIPPPLGRGAQWRLISCLALNHLSLANGPRALEALRELLILHDFASLPGNRTAILEGLTAVSAEPDTARAGHPTPALCRGVRIHLTFDESRFTVGSAFLLASVLDRFFAHYVSINSFTRLVAHARSPERIIRTWPARDGARPLA